MKEINQLDLEGYIKDSPEPVSIEGTEKILFQMKKCVCKITKENRVNGTGFFCKIPFPGHSDLLPILATNYHILDKNYMEKVKNIEVTLNDDDEKKIINIGESRIIFSDENLDVTFIQIKPEKDNIKHFLEISEDIIMKDNNILKTIYKNRKSIYIMHYPKGKKNSSIIWINI